MQIERYSSMKDTLDVISHVTRQNTLRTPEPKGVSAEQRNILVAHRHTFAMHETITFNAFYRSQANRILANRAKLLRRLSEDLATSIFPTPTRIKDSKKFAVVTPSAPNSELVW